MNLEVTRAAMQATADPLPLAAGQWQGEIQGERSSDHKRGFEQWRRKNESRITYTYIDWFTCFVVVCWYARYRLFVCEQFRLMLGSGVSALGQIGPRRI